MSGPPVQEPQGELSDEDLELLRTLRTLFPTTSSVTVASQEHPTRAVQVFLGAQGEVIGVGDVAVPQDAIFEQAGESDADFLSVVGGPLFLRICMQCNPHRSLGRFPCTHS